MAPETSPTVLVAADDASFLDEVVRHLEEIPNWKLVTCLGAADSILTAVESHLPDAVVVLDTVAREMAKRPAVTEFGTLVVVGRQEHTASLKAALRLGARGFVCWPGQARQLRPLVERDWSNRRPISAGQAPGRVHAVWAPKGGSGASVIAAHLVWSLGRHAERCLLADLDIDHADQTTILGIPEEAKTIMDLVRMGDELSASIAEGAAWEHPEGFKAVPGPGSPGESGLVKGRDLAAVLGVLRQASAHVVADLPSGLNEIALGAIEESDDAVVVVTPDLLSLKRARDSIRILRGSGLDDSRLCLVVNQSGPAGVSAKDVGSVVGLKVAAEVRADLHFYQAINRGQLSPSAKKMLSKLARRLADAPSHERTPGRVRAATH